LKPNPRTIAHIAALLVVVGMLIYAAGYLFFEQTGSSILYFMIPQFLAFPVAIFGLIINFSAQKERKLGLLGFIETGFGMLPAIIGGILYILISAYLH
jgi:hypothetical protein